MKALILTAFALVTSAWGVAAAPFDFQRSAFRWHDNLGAEYVLNRATLLADIRYPFSFVVGGPDAFRSFALDGQLDAGAGSGVLTLSTLEEGAREVYAVDIRGNLGEDFFTEEIDAIAKVGLFISVPVPDFRLDLRPVGGRDLDALFPNGFSISTRCRRSPARCSIESTAPSSIVFATGDPEFPTGYLFQNAPVELAPIPVPGAMGLSALALLSLGWAGYRHRG